MPILELRVSFDIQLGLYAKQELCVFVWGECGGVCVSKKTNNECKCCLCHEQFCVFASNRFAEFYDKALANKHSLDCDSA